MYIVKADRKIKTIIISIIIIIDIIAILLSYYIIKEYAEFKVTIPIIIFSIILSVFIPINIRKKIKVYENNKIICENLFRNKEIKLKDIRYHSIRYIDASLKEKDIDSNKIIILMNKNKEYITSFRLDACNGNKLKNDITNITRRL